MRVVVQRVSFARVSRDSNDTVLVDTKENTTNDPGSVDNLVNVSEENDRVSGLNDGSNFNSISTGLLVLLGIETEDDENDVNYIIGKLSRLRIFDDESGIMNLSIMDVKGEFLVISQFTLHAETRKGNRPSYIRAARPEQAIPLYELFLSELHKLTGLNVKAGWFGARMKVELANEGPVTIIMDSK